MSVRVGLLASLLLLGVACVLPAGTKTKCRTDDDCLGTRICVGVQCSPPCEHLCLRDCEAAAECGIEGLHDCEAQCDFDSPEVLAVPEDAATCKQRWIDAAAEIECDALLCGLHCAALCSTAAECGDVDDEAACRDGCEQSPPAVCDPATVTSASCDENRDAARCAEARGIEGVSVDCSSLPCGDDYDCEPDELCDYARCLPRCVDDDDCVWAECVSDHCTAPVGTPCGGPFDVCFGGYCINVDADNLTTDYYCSIFCSDDPCPSGYECFDYNCRRCNGPCDCPYQGDGECDEPEGTGLCDEGSDPYDC